MLGLGKRGNLIVLVCLAIVGLFLYGRLRIPLVDDIRGNIVQSAHFGEILTKDAIIDRTNEEREAHGLHHLSENELLNAIAEARVRDMLEKQYFGHVSPTGGQASDIAQEVGYRYKIIAENLAQGYFPTNKKMVDGWMQSPGHRENILSSDVKEIGVAIVKGRLNGREISIGVQIFGLESPQFSLKTCAAPSQELVREIETKKEEINGLRGTLGRLKEELEEGRRSIEADRNSIGSQSQDSYNLNVKINAHNEKSNWHNRIVADVSAKTMVLQSMIEEYNRAVQDYQNCRNSK